MPRWSQMTRISGNPNSHCSPPPVKQSVMVGFLPHGCGWARGQLVGGGVQMQPRGHGSFIHVGLGGRRDYAGVINFRILRWEIYPVLFGWAECNHKCSYKRKAVG